MDDAAVAEVWIVDLKHRVLNAFRDPADGTALQHSMLGNTTRFCTAGIYHLAAPWLSRNAVTA